MESVDPRSETGDAGGILAEPRPADAGPTASTMARERDDLILLAAGVLSVAAGWFLLGWRWPLCVSGYDAWATALPIVRQLVQAGGDWAALAYRPELLGGTKVRDAMGPNPLLALLARTGLHTTGVYDLAALALQACLGFLGARAGADLARLCAQASGGPVRTPGWWWRLAGLWLCAFAPALGWRIGYGHLALTFGVLPFQAALALVAAAAARTMSITLAVVATLAAVNGLLFTGHQLVLYGVVFGSPILAGLWCSARAPVRRLLLPALLLAAAVLLAWPGLKPVLAHGLGTDSPRAPFGMRITYSYLTATPLDWLSSVPWTRAAIPGRREALLHHETNLPLGPLLLVVALLPWRRLRPLAWGAALSAALALLFSMHVRPFSWLLLMLVPPLGSFRVPTRAALPLLALLPVAAMAAVAWAATLHGPVNGRARRGVGALAVAGGAAGFVLLAALSSLVREALGWLLALALVTGLCRRRLRPAWAAAACWALAGGSLGAFGERLLPFGDTEKLLARAAKLGEQARALDPQVGSPLVRVAPAVELPALGANTAFAAGLSSLDGYLFPSRRFITLTSALRAQPYQPSAFVLRFRVEHASDRALFQLYNVRWLLRALPAMGETEPGSEARTLSVPHGVPATIEAPVRPIELVSTVPTAGPAWLSAGVRSVDSFDTLARELRGAGDALHTQARQTLWVVASDAKVPPLPSAGTGCAQARVRNVQADRQGRFAVSLQTAAECPLTIATNYAESLRARALVDGRWQPVALFPAYGALLGAWLPPGTTRIEVAPAP